MGEMRRRGGWVRAGIVLFILAWVLAACTNKGTDRTPSPVEDSPERAAAELADGLTKADLSSVEFAGASSADVNRAFQALVAGMGPVRPDVGVASLNARPAGATASLRFTWSFPGVPTSWVYDTTAELAKDASRWKASWSPGVVFSGLDGRNRLSQHRLYPTRGELLGEDGDPIVTARPVMRIGIDKSRIPPRAAATSARRLAAATHIDAKRYAAKVAAAGPSAFVEAIVLRVTDTNRLPDRQVTAIPGALAIYANQMLAPTAQFARAVIGTVGEATQEIVDASGGAVVGGDEVGLSGLQLRYDSLMRGTPGVVVQLVAAKPDPTPAGPSPSSPTPTVGPPADSATTLFEVRPVAGKNLTTTLNIGLQNLAEKALARTKPASAVVAIRPSTGAIVAAANGSGSNGQSIATVGQFPPGSTFKIVSALALMRAGLQPNTAVSCPRTVTVDGRTFKNYDDYPSSQLGRIPLRTAFAQSCNTAFIGQAGRLSSGDLAAAAESLGVGMDYDVGFPAYLGSVPADDTLTGQAAAMIGQGKVQVSPLAMAAAASSVAAGRTIVPHLVQDQVAKPTGKPLTATESARLRSMMRSVVTAGTATFLSDIPGGPVLAKTGTAEYGSAQPPRTHAWMVAVQGDLAVAVFVADGSSGSRTAGPLLEAFLRGTR